MEYRNELLLPDGTPCLLRSPAAGDASAVLAHLVRTSGETDNMARYPDEIRMSAEEEAAFLERIRLSDRSLMISAFLGDRLVANAGFDPVNALSRCRHRATFGISVQSAFWGRGIGSALLGAAIGAARDAGYEQLELDVVTGNDRAIALYRKFGFLSYGTLPRAFRYRDGRHTDLTLMYLPL